jgi:membrane protease YdiL (CAAX protease family)
MRPAAAALVVLAVAVTAVTSYLAFSPERSGTAGFWGLTVAPAVGLAAVAAVWAYRDELLSEWLTPRWGDATRGVFGAVVLFFAAWASARTVMPVGSPREVWLVSLYGQLGDPRWLQTHAPLVAGAIIVAAAAEELVWRGMVTQLLAERVGSRAAWVWAAVLYTLSYTPTIWALRSSAGLNPVLVACALGGGVLWGAMARAFGRLAPGVLAHALFDWAAVMMFPLWGIR